MFLAALCLLAAPAGETITKTAEEIEFRAGTEVAARYKFAGTVQVEKGTDTKPLAKPYFWPIVAPGGTPVTRAWPMARGTAGETTDHFHQKSVWFCHGDVIPTDKTLKVKSADKRVHGVDFWAEGGNHGRIVCVKVDEPKENSVTTANEWQAADGELILTETRTITFHALPAGYLFVLDIDLAASAGGVTFGDTKEGAMGVRVPDGVALAKGNGTVVSSDGTTVKAGTTKTLPVWGKPADWHDYSSDKGGIAVFDHPTNAHRANWHTRDYGLMAANPFGRGDSGFPAVKGRSDVVKLAAGEHLKLTYGVYAHTGDAAGGKVAEAFAGFAK